MTLEKIKHHIGVNMFEYIGNLNKKQLQKMKSDILTDINLPQVKQDSKMLFKRVVELEYIKSRIN